MGRYSIKTRASSLLLFVALFFFAVLFLPISEALDRNLYIGFQFIFIGFFAIFQMVKENSVNNFSLNLTHWFFIYTFMFSAGITQFANNTFRWGLYPTAEEVYKANNIIILWCVLYSLLFYLNRSPKIESAKEAEKIEPKYNRHGLGIIVFFLVTLSCITLYLVDFKAFFVRSLYETSSLNQLLNSSSLSMVALSLMRGLSLWCMMITLVKYKNSKTASNLFLMLITFFCSLILVPPLGIARYVFACFYGGLCLFYFDVFKHKNIFIYVLFFGLLIIFPMLNAFRGLYTLNVTVEFIKECIGNIKKNFSTADYDSYTMLVYSVRYCAENGVTWGKQLLGVVLFFIPRTFWRMKPEGSGALIIETMDNSGVNPNVSCPLIGEGYMNFGICGVIIFCIIFSSVIRKIDTCYKKIWQGRSVWGQMFYAYFVFYLMFLLRGDLMSTFSTLCGYLASLFIVRFLVRAKQTE